MSSLIWDSLFLFFFFQSVCFSFPFLIALTEVSYTVRNKSGKNRHLCFVLKTKKETFSLSSWGIILPVRFLLILFIKWKKVPFITSFLRDFIINDYWILPYSFFELKYIICGFYFSLLIWWTILIYFEILEQSCFLK